MKPIEWTPPIPAGEARELMPWEVIDLCPDYWARIKEQA